VYYWSLSENPWRDASDEAWAWRAVSAYNAAVKRSENDPAEPPACPRRDAEPPVG
jgi:hypothetical protein